MCGWSQLPGSVREFFCFLEDLAFVIDLTDAGT
uniref:Uncharacterized protein n=1 Tax=Arundo donax TaxID=35708 RepID=A0A0A8ZKF7_ARUDO